MGTEPLPRYSLVIPVFNEEAVLPLLMQALDAVLGKLDGAAEVILVDDGSRDGTPSVIRAKTQADPRYRYIGLSRNFGKEIAVTAGLDRAAGAAIVIMDADLQDPPELILQMIAAWKEGNDIVYGQRAERGNESWFKRTTARWFYRLLSVASPVEMPSDICDFRLIDRSVLDSFRSMRERDRFVRGMFAWMGYRQKAITFERPKRAKGETKWPAGKLLALALDGIMSFSDAPLKLAIWAGALVSAVAIGYGIFVILLRISDPDILPGWSSIVVIIAFLSGINMLLTGIVGLYVGRIHNEVKARPLYLVRDSAGFIGSPEVQRTQWPPAHARGQVNDS